MTGAWLALDTAAPRACVVVVVDGQPRAVRLLKETRRHAEELGGAIDGCLAEAGLSMSDLVGVGVGAGPGSFVGVRVGIAHAKGLCGGLRVPLVGLCSLTALASDSSLPDGKGYALLDARRGEVYLRAVVRERGIARPLDEPEALSPDDATARAQDAAFLVGNAISLLGPAPGVKLPLDGPTHAGLAAHLVTTLEGGVVDEQQTLVPRYCRPPDAKLPG